MFADLLLELKPLEKFLVCDSFTSVDPGNIFFYIVLNSPPSDILTAFSFCVLTYDTSWSLFEHVFYFVLKIVRSFRQRVEQSDQILADIFSRYGKGKEIPKLIGVGSRVLLEQRIDIFIFFVHQSRLESGDLLPMHMLRISGKQYLFFKNQPPESIGQIVFQYGELLFTWSGLTAVVPFFGQGQLG